MTEQEVKDNMVSCYDNGDAMLEYAEEYFNQRLCATCQYENCHTCPAFDYEYGVTPLAKNFGCNHYKELDAKN